MKNLFIRGLLYGILLCGVTFSCTPGNDTTQPIIQPVDQVYPLLDAANSRWFYFASACRPFGMVTLNPDTQVGGAWGSGYKYNTDTVKGLSHIHGWQIAGVSVMPVTVSSRDENLLEDYYSSFNHEKETVEVGYHRLYLDRYQVKIELTSTKRVGFHRYTFPIKSKPGIVFQLNGQLGPSMMKAGKLTMINEYTLKGQIVNAPTKRRPKDFKVFYHISFNKPISEIVQNHKNALVLFAKDITQLKMKVGISYTSCENAKLNLQTELSDWDFEKVVKDSKDEWNSLLGRILVTDDDSIEVRRFYTDLWHSLQGRRTISDVNGAYPDNTGEQLRIGQLPLDQSGNPQFNHYNSDAFWGAQWTLNTLWGLVYPEVYSEFVKSLMVYYQDGGLVPRGPSGGNYTYVMTGASSTPFVVSAFQKGIDIGDPEDVYEAIKRNHISRGIMSKAGYEHDTFLGGGMEYYMDKGYVPYPIPEGDFGYHQDGASLTLEYAYQDWTLAQMAKTLGKKEDYQYFLKRSENYQNVFDQSTGWMRPKNIKGNWKEPFDPYQYEHGFNESNGAQSTWFVPHDIAGLAELMGGKETAVEKLNEQFQKAALLNFTAGTSHERGEDPNRARIPINFGNQPSIQTAFIFNQLGRPDLTQYWSGEVVRKALGGLSPSTGYNGDEDQGLMGALAVLYKLGIFQMNGGTDENPVYELSSPMFNSVEIKLPKGKNLRIKKNNSDVFFKKITFDQNEVRELRHRLIIGGGELKFGN